MVWSSSSDVTTMGTSLPPSRHRSANYGDVAVTAPRTAPPPNGCTSVSVHVLGEISLAVDGHDRPLSRQSRRLLGCLVLAGNGALSVDRLGAVLDPDGRPRPATVRMAVSRLRRHLDGRLVGGAGGYRLVFGPFDEFDLDAFVG